MTRLELVRLAVVSAALSAAACQQKKGGADGGSDPPTPSVQSASSAASPTTPASGDDPCGLAPPSQVASVLGLPALSVTALPSGPVTSCSYDSADEKKHVHIRFERLQPRELAGRFQTVKKTYKNPKDLPGVGEYALTDSDKQEFGKYSVTVHTVEVWKGSMSVQVVSAHSTLDKEIQLSREIAAKL